MSRGAPSALPASLARHRVHHRDVGDVCVGKVRFSPAKGAWFLGMAGGALVGGALTVSTPAVALFVVSTAVVLLFGHSLGSHRKLVHDSFQCPRWLEYLLVYLGVQVGLAGPIGLLRQHELRDYAQRLPTCHDYLRHGRSFWVDAWWQLVCDLRLEREPPIRVEARIAQDRFYRFLERTWMAQQIPWALLFYYWGGWAFVFWGVCARVTAGVFGHWLIGYFAHNHGDMHHVVEGAAVRVATSVSPRCSPWVSAGTTITTRSPGRRGSGCSLANGIRAGGRCGASKHWDWCGGCGCPRTSRRAPSCVNSGQRRASRAASVPFVR